jgi:hypothetical protein
VEKLKVIMGHSSVEMTIRYLGIEEMDIMSTLQYRPKYEEMYLGGHSQL